MLNEPSAINGSYRPPEHPGGVGASVDSPTESSGSQLIKYDQACRAIAECVTTDEVKAIRNRAEAIRAASRIAKNKELEVQAAEIRIRAERRLGELILEQKRTVGLNPGTRLLGGGAGAGGAIEEPPAKIPTLADAGIDKKLSSRAQKLAAVPETKFNAMLSGWRERVSSETERVTVNLLREGERAQQAAEKVSRPLPRGKFSLLYADPPWRYEHVKTESRAIENKYPTMSLDEICELEVPAADDCILFLWATSPKVAEAIQVIEAWGFTYRTSAVWDKGQIGMGYYVRQQHEMLLIATKGSPGAPEPARRPASVFYEQRREHSRKPDCVIQALEVMYPDLDGTSRCELFQREPRPGWSGWGNEVGCGLEPRELEV